MLNERERQFVQYWEANRLREKQWQQQLMAGIPMGLLFALPVLAIIFTGKLWYKRADMMIRSQTSLILVLVIAALLIVIFVAVFSAKHQWDLNEQRYKEFLAKKSSPDFFAGLQRFRGMLVFIYKLLHLPPIEIEV